MFTLTPEILQKIIKIEDERAKVISDSINEICPQYGIDSADILHEFLANVIHESGGFKCKSENLNYSAKRLMQVWPTRFKTIEDAEKVAGNPMKLANLVYGGRKDLGNVQEADGWLFRGSGFIQMTGRSNFVAFASYMRQKFNLSKPLDQWADEVRNNDFWAMHSACYIFAISMKLIDAALANNMTYIVKRINGGYIGMEDRLKYYELCKLHIK
jgi:putative chitinase